MPSADPRNQGSGLRNCLASSVVCAALAFAGPAVGGFSPKRAGKVEGCTFVENTLVDNTTAGQGEIWIQAASGNTFERNRIHGTGERPLLQVEKMTGDDIFKNNSWSSDIGAAKSIFARKSQWCEGLAAYQIASGQGEFGEAKPSGGVSFTKLLEVQP